MSLQIRRRSLLPLAAGLFATARAYAATAELEAAAKREGALTWYTAHTDGETAQLTAKAFSDRYPGIAVSVVRTTAQVAYQRLLQDIKNGIAQCDVFSSTDLGHDEALRQQGKLARFTPDDVDALRPAMRNLDPTGTYYATLAELVAPIYNSARVKDADIPRSWTDLLDPKWKNQVAVGHPAYSGTVGTWVVAMRKTYGWEYFEKLEKLNPLIGRSVNDAVGVVNSGERLVAAGPSGLTQTTQMKGNPIALSYPTDGAVLIVSPSAVMANAPHPNAARLFMDFLLSPAHAKLSTEFRRVPVRSDAPQAVGEKPLDQIKLIQLSTPEIVAGIPDVIEQWRDLFGS